MTRAPRGTGAARATARRAAPPGARARGRTAARANGRARLDTRALMAQAVIARCSAYAPYSRFPVGAALLARDGRIILGCNVENASYGMSVCAERAAVWKAVSEGIREFEAIAITAREGHGAPPCGACRQIMQEFAPHMTVLWRDDRGRIRSRRLTELLPQAFVFRGGRA